MNRRFAMPVAASPPMPATRSAGAPALDLPPRLRPHAALGVLDVTKYFGPTSGGIKTYLLEKARYVAVRPECRQVLVVPGPADEVETHSGFRTYRLKGPRIPLNPPYRFLLATRSLRRILEHERPDIIEVGSPFLVPWLVRHANRHLDARTVWYYHSHLPELVAPPGGAATTWLRRGASAALARYVRVLGRRFPVVVAASRFAATELAALGVEQVVQVPLGVDLHSFHPGRKAWAAETRRAAGWPDGPVALYCGRFAGEKRLDVILDAWPEVERRCRMRLALVGAGPIEDRLRAHPYASRVLWLPYQRDRGRLADLLAAADVYVAPGPIETFGLSVLEALASGTPVLSVDRGAGPELVSASLAGVSYHDGEPEHAAEAAVWLSKQNLAALGVRGRSYAERHHHWDGVLDRLWDVYRGILRGSC